MREASQNTSPKLSTLAGSFELLFKNFRYKGQHNHRGKPYVANLAVRRCVCNLEGGGKSRIQVGAVTLCQFRTVEAINVSTALLHQQHAT